MRPVARLFRGPVRVNPSVAGVVAPAEGGASVPPFRVCRLDAAPGVDLALVCNCKSGHCSPVLTVHEVPSFVRYAL